jgi:hypothetical protein
MKCRPPRALKPWVSTGARCRQTPVVFRGIAAGPAAGQIFLGRTTFGPDPGLTWRSRAPFFGTTGPWQPTLTGVSWGSLLAGVRLRKSPEWFYRWFPRVSALGNGRRHDSYGVRRSPLSFSRRRDSGIRDGGGAAADRVTAGGRTLGPLVSTTTLIGLSGVVECRG